MASFIRDNFMLRSVTAQHLFNLYGAAPIVDFHCHLLPKEIADDYTSRSITEMMLGADHYKWRAMRLYGIEEEYITGKADDREKFRKFAEMMPMAIGSPLYHWTHLELLRYFGINECLSKDSADEIFDECNRQIQNGNFSARSLMRRSNVKAVCTTDDPLDSLEYHKAIREDGFEIKVLPAFRPDNALNIEMAPFEEYVQKAGAKTFDEFVAKLVERLDFFVENGCVATDTGMQYVPFKAGNASAVFEKRMNGGKLTKDEIDIYKTQLLYRLGKEYAKRNLVMQLHIGPMRNNNTAMFERIGKDAGFDSVYGGEQLAWPLSRLLDSLEYEDMLPKTVLYTLDPKDYTVLGTMLGNFAKAPVKGKLQLGSAWWFCDRADGMEEQLRLYAGLSVLGTFIGMLTDSRSFLSYTRHEYFRRIFCNYVGDMVDHGEYPNDEKFLEALANGVFYENAKEYFGL